MDPGTGSFVDTKTGKTVSYPTYGGKSINQWMKYLTEHGTGVGGLQSLIAGMKPDDARRFTANLFKMENVMGSTGQLVFKHSDEANILHAFRYMQRPEWYTKLSPEDEKKLKAGNIAGLNFSPKTIAQLAEVLGKASVYENITTSEFDPHYLLGDFSTSDLLKIISSARTKKQRESIFASIHHALQSDIVDGTVSTKHDAFNFLRGLNDRWDSGEREHKKDESHKALTELLNYLQRNDDSVRMALNGEHEFTRVDEMVEETL